MVLIWTKDSDLAILLIECLLIRIACFIDDNSRYYDRLDRDVLIITVIYALRQIRLPLDLQNTLAHNLGKMQTHLNQLSLLNFLKLVQTIFRFRILRKEMNWF